MSHSLFTFFNFVFGEDAELNIILLCYLLYCTYLSHCCTICMPHCKYVMNMLWSPLAEDNKV